MSVDDIFTPAGFVVALLFGFEPTVCVTNPIQIGVRLSYDDVTCRRCDRPIDTPRRNTARFLAVNKRYNDGLCRRCDPVVGPRPPTTE